MMANDRDYDEGPEAAERFRETMRRLVNVSKDEIDRRREPPVKRRGVTAPQRSRKRPASGE